MQKKEEIELFIKDYQLIQGKLDELENELIRIRRIIGRDFGSFERITDIDNNEIWFNVWYQGCGRLPTKLLFMSDEELQVWAEQERIKEEKEKQKRTEG